MEIFPQHLVWKINAYAVNAILYHYLRILLIDIHFGSDDMDDPNLSAHFVLSCPQISSFQVFIWNKL